MELGCLIVDEEPLTRADIRLLLQQQAQFGVIAEADNTADALTLARLHQPDIIFLDIQLPMPAGINLLQQLEYKPTLILCSRSADDAFTAFELNAADFLLKPLRADRFQQALLKACAHVIDKLASQSLATMAAPLLCPSHLTIREPGRFRIVAIEDISWIESAGNYVEIHLYSQSKSLLLRDTMISLQQKLNPNHFARVHRSHIVRKSDILEIRTGDKGDGSIMLKCGTVILMSRRYRDNLSELFGSTTPKPVIGNSHSCYTA
ncbi:LytR/AlgR family response regulator transcription factor [Rheinheimera oceanensis]|uniref:LytR/AlgR family response regulator transcription factor n=1 Tax=Rheinheimera oceanensis TaxID=2817449 RepID=UPI001BFDA01D|nr:LytTR family DNA-binding domain-containing protein [Rheinheimera oceanensis]